MHGTELDSPAWEEDNISTKTEENQTIEDETKNGGHIHLLIFQYALRQVENLTLTSMYSNLYALCQCRISNWNSLYLHNSFYAVSVRDPAPIPRQTDCSKTLIESIYLLRRIIFRKTYNMDPFQSFEEQADQR